MPGTFTPSGPWTSRQCRTASSRGMPSLNLTSQMTLYMCLLLHQALLHHGPPGRRRIGCRLESVVRGAPRGRRERPDQRRPVLEPVLRAAVEPECELRRATLHADRLARDVEHRALQARHLAEQRLGA